ncbi:MAG: 1-(5-phosphoribosyl)-5-[(5-phosphoribosylamino)methylideneamino] imidazole-4-carboxamide isomerase, partial [Actinomycetia bacterium]|nr:1-(5-phosphoribosyl)-5-[(5-phosphoribosylamino)methylideneamino] imidazole-4-carboxamide isomerase [Actinomycetes bacterium]
GGVGTLDHLRQLAAIEESGRRLDGVIVGKAIYEGAFTVAEALAALK